MGISKCRSGGECSTNPKLRTGSCVGILTTKGSVVRSGVASSSLVRCVEERRIFKSSLLTVSSSWQQSFSQQVLSSLSVSSCWQSHFFAEPSETLSISPPQKWYTRGTPLVATSRCARSTRVNMLESKRMVDKTQLTKNYCFCKVRS